VPPNVESIACWITVVTGEPDRRPEMLQETAPGAPVADVRPCVWSIPLRRQGKYLTGASSTTALEGEDHAPAGRAPLIVTLCIGGGQGIALALEML
jgi:hypothetical protein